MASTPPAQKVVPSVDYHVRMNATAALLCKIYEIVEQLEGLYPERSFKPDGHLVGSIGEAWAQWMYDLELFSQSNAGHDARAKTGALVQIKATQGKSVGIYSEPSHLIVLRIMADGTPVEIYNGPGELAWNSAGPMQKNGQRSLGTAKLSELMKQVPASARLPVVNTIVAT